MSISLKYYMNFTITENSSKIPTPTCSRGSTHTSTCTAQWHIFHWTFIWLYIPLTTHSTHPPTSNQSGPADGPARARAGPSNGNLIWCIFFHLISIILTLTQTNQCFQFIDQTSFSSDGDTTFESALDPESPRWLGVWGTPLPSGPSTPYTSAIMEEEEEEIIWDGEFTSSDDNVSEGQTRVSALANINCIPA